MRYVGNLRDTDVGGHFFRMLGGIDRPEYRAPRMTEQYDLILFKTLPDHFHHLVEIAHELGNGHGRRRNVGMERASSATLFPIDDHKMLLKGRIIVAKES